MRNSVVVKRCALGAATGFAGLAVYQFLLAAGAPLGAAAWGGGTEGQLPTSLRVGSAVTVLVYAGAAGVTLRRAGFRVRGVSSRVAHVGSWVLVVLLPLGALPNFASASAWERSLLGPAALVLAGLCWVVARSAEDAVVAAAGDAGRLRAAH